MAVCRRWRSILLPHAYRRLIIESKTPYDRHEALSPGITPYYSYRDSIRLIESTVDIVPRNLHIQPRKLNLIINNNITEYVNLVHHIVSLLEQQQNFILISNIAYVTISNVDGPSFSSHDQNYLDKSIGEMQVLAHRFIRLFPKITSVDWLGLNHNPVLLSFAKSLYMGYMSQLSKIRAELSIIESEPNGRYNNITSLTIAKPAGPWNHLPVNPVPLKQLTITRYSDGFCWDSFMSKDNEAVLRFDSLETLTMDMVFDFRNPATSNGSVVWVGPKTALRHKIRAPNLKTVNLELCPFSCSLLASIESTGRLQKLTIRSLYGVHLVFYDFAMTEAAKALFLEHSKSTSETVDNVKFVDTILNLHDLAQIVRVELHNFYSSGLKNHAYWSNVHHLRVHKNIGLLDLFNAVKKMHNLVSIYATWVFINPNYTSKEYERHMEDLFLSFPTPLPTGIKHITLKFMPKELPRAISGLLNSKIRKHIPSLVSLTISGKN
ncbi:hypothetical protein H4217_007472 [Coemansia sp. RSA 1939]|nr:hypothetical protein H4217_007472 [Coemansia sp. RSA 1939]KAJ2605567.1 hypothetical protein EV177_006122 [Coemansia sp. RSA 1804]KAJ2666139.1 hypothetical protein GGH99_006783 [Coemansia sp. RSA 1285]